MFAPSSLQRGTNGIPGEGSGIGIDLEMVGVGTLEEVVPGALSANERVGASGDP